MLEGSFKFNVLLTLPALVLTILLAVVTGALSPNFVTETNLANLATRLLPLGLVALGEAMVLFAGRIDLSVGSIFSLSTAIVALTSDTLGWYAIPVTLVIGIACGLFNAAGINLFRINPLVMGLATAAIVKGVTLLILPSPGGEVNYELYDALFGSERLLAMPLFLTIGAYAALVVIMGWTRFGRSIYAFGSDQRAAFVNGVSAWKVDLAVYGVSGFFAAAAGIAVSIKILSGDPLIGEAYTLDAVSAAILGGVALQGGRGSLIGVLLATISLVLVNNAFNLLDLDTNFQNIAKGLIFVLALVFFMRGKAGEA